MVDVPIPPPVTAVRRVAWGNQLLGELLMSVQSWLDDNLPRLVAQYDVPAAAVAVLADGEISEAASGILNLRTGVEATTDSVFQVGSVTKLWTTTLVMQLVEDGLLDLDQPVRDCLPEFALSDPVAAKTVTPRQLLTHTSGFAGDAFTPTSRGDDAVELFVRDVVPTLAQEVAPGTGFSYNNSGFVVLGRIAEVLRGKPFHTLVRDRIGEPLGLQRLATIPEEALLHRTALGHVAPKPGDPLEPAPVWSLVHSMGPAGSLLAMSAGDLVSFGRAYLDNQLVTEETRDRLWSPQVDLPDIGGFAAHWGLGWMIFDVDGGRMYGHDGGTLGQSAYFRMVPDRGVVIALLTNGDSSDLYDDLVGHLLRELAGLELPARPIPPERPPEIPEELYLGRFDGVLTSHEISVDGDGQIWSVESPLTDEARLLLPEPDRRRLVPLDVDRLITAEPDHGRHLVLVFRQPGPDGRAAYLFRGGRLIPRSD